MGEHGNLLEIFGFGAGALSLGFSVFVAVSQLRVGSVPMTLFKGLLSVLCGALLTYAIVLLSICQASGELLALCCLCLLCAMSQALLFFVKSPPPRLSSASPLLLLLSQGILLVLVLPVNDPEALLVPLVATSTSLTGFLTLLCLFTRPVPAPLGYSSLTTPDGRVVCIPCLLYPGALSFFVCLSII